MPEAAGGDPRPRASRGLVSALALCAVLHAPSGATSVARIEPEDQILAQLDRLDEPGSDPQAVADEIATLAAGSVVTLLDLMERGRPGPDGAGTVRLARAEMGVLLDAAAFCGRGAVLPVLTIRAEAGMSHAARLVALCLLERVGEGADLPLLVEVATPSDRNASVEGDVVRALCTATEAMLRRDETGYQHLARLLLDVRLELRTPLVRGIAAAESPAGLPSLVRILGFSPGLDPVLLESIGALAPVVPLPVEPEVAGAIRRYLFDEDARLVREAAFALGRLHDFDSTESLIGLLEHSSGLVAGTCHRALQEITGLRFPAHPERWQSWYNAESRWLAREAPALFASLDDADPGRVVHALNELCRRRLSKSTLANEVAGVLDRREPALRRLACLALRRLGGPRQTQALLERLDDADESVAKAALAALRAITGKDLPFDKGACKRALETGRAAESDSKWTRLKPSPRRAE